jgi:hypothetical protein
MPARTDQADEKVLLGVVYGKSVARPSCRDHVAVEGVVVDHRFKTFGRGGVEQDEELDS